MKTWPTARQKRRPLWGIGIGTVAMILNGIVMVRNLNAFTIVATLSCIVVVFVELMEYVSIKTLLEVKEILDQPQHTQQDEERGDIANRVES